MAISSYSTAADAGVLFVILANAAMSISIMKDIVRSILQVIGIRIASWEELSVDPSESAECHRSPSEPYMEEFRSQIPAMRYDSIFICSHLQEECSICLTEFEANMEVNQLVCGHVFHKQCLERWLNYWNITCPLCRNYMTPQEAEDDACPIFESRDMLVGVKPDFLWYLHRNEPACVVGEHRQSCRLMLDDLSRVTGEVGTEDEDDKQNSGFGLGVASCAIFVL